mgnify:CR=1 FL=1
MAKIDTTKLGEYIREQRNSAHISLRQLAKTADISNPYLSQVERGLRKPSAEVLQQIAKALQEDVVEAIARELRGPSAAPANPRTAAVDDDRTGSRN